MATSRSSMGQEIRLAPGKRARGIKNSIISRAKGDLTGFSKANYKARAIRPGGMSSGGRIGKGHKG